MSDSVPHKLRIHLSWVVISLGCISTAVTAPEWAAARSRSPSEIIGEARVIDGDTLVISGVRIRLEGIDAPEIGQTCGRKWLGSWDCGQAASRELARLVAGQPVTCRRLGEDRYGRSLARCLASGQDVNAEMVRRGHAWAFLKYSRAYVEDEAAARSARLGVWQGEAEPAWVYRERRWQAEAALAPEGCAIKGNVSRHGQIYHMPWSPWYTQIRLDKGRGERWFCSEAEAIAAGWRPAAGG